MFNQVKCYYSVIWSAAWFRFLIFAPLLTLLYFTLLSYTSLHNGHILETWNWLNFALTLWSICDPHVSFTWVYAFNILFELCLHCVQIQVHIMLIFRNFNVDFVSSSWMISFFMCSFTCRLTITFHASFSNGLSSNACAVGRPYL